MTFTLDGLVRPNILKLLPYRCARDDYNGDGYIFLDANENAYGPSLGDYLDRQSLNRYPDPQQVAVKELVCKLRGGTLAVENVFCGVGSDEAIDCVMRVFCRPGQDKILVTPPTYGMYGVSATINDVGVVKVPLEGDRFQPNLHKVMDALKDTSIKIVFFCSPGNPTGELVDRDIIISVLESGWHGMVCVDEAYIDFSPQGSSLSTLVTKYPNLIVMQTLSKAFGLAAIRLGVAFASKEVATIMNSLKAPYNISTPTSDLAARALGDEGLSTMRENVRKLNANREALVRALLEVDGIGGVIGGTSANFIMAKVEKGNKVALAVYEQMAKEQGIVVRFRGNEHGCEGCLRVTVGTEEENSALLERLTRAFEVVGSLVKEDGAGKLQKELERELEVEKDKVLE
ncbi:histidinol-phosphate transaminase [Savitreella phatthalungensis]